MAKSHKKDNKQSKEYLFGKFVGSWAFILGLVFAVVLGLLGEINEIWVVVLILIGLLIGLLNISEEETTSFLVSGVILIIIAVLGGSVFSSMELLGNVLNALLIIFVPATVIVAIKNVFMLAKD
jgi:hypothetical protein